LKFCTFFALSVSGRLESDNMQLVEFCEIFGILLDNAASVLQLFFFCQWLYNEHKSAETYGNYAREVMQ